ncbi:MAG: ATP-binding protein [Clostridiales Family XIII bacterium]|jgi:predicted AAA+ superfamily ATPase|nr:ATP-binding protein [Clostridiales Family XIII bacterium]
MKRALLSSLKQWKESENRKPLILKGVRQCGKTYLLKEFGAACYDDVAYFNFEGDKALGERFERNLDVTRIVTELGVIRKKAIMPERTLIIFDEIQFCNPALTSLKYFYENAPEYHIVCAGSLLGIALSKPLSFPVGKVDFLTLRPMNFHEFLLANGEELLCEHLKGLSPNEKAPDMFVSRLEDYLRTYYITGGMPEAVDTWVKTKDIDRLEIVQQQILNSYELDFAKHAPSKDFPKLSAVWRSVPLQLSKENSKFIFSQVKKGWRAKDLEDALEWLISAGIVYKVTKIEKPYVPLSAYADESYFKLYLSDVGLLRKMAGLSAGFILQKNDAFREFKGAMTENYFLEEWLHGRDAKVFYWKSGNIAEVDFIVQHDVDIIPVEVKSERNDKAKSLAEYRKKYSPKISVKTSMNNVSMGDVRHIPLYLLWQAEKYLED